MKEKLSVFDIFKIGVGPSSSHTLGPWRAAQQFLQEQQDNGTFNNIETIQVYLYGSLAKTGKGHGTDIAIQLGLSGEDPVTFDPALLHLKIDSIKTLKQLDLAGAKKVAFNPETDLVFLRKESLPFHPNALKFKAILADKKEVEETYYSIGGGFVAKENESISNKKAIALKYDIADGDDLLQTCMSAGLGIAELVMENEKSWRTKEETHEGLMRIWNVMLQCIYKGCHSDGILPGGLSVIRRAANINKKLLKDKHYTNATEWMQQITDSNPNFQEVVNWVSCFALAVNEENASFGRVVTAPTNGAAGVVPAVLMYTVLFCKKNKEHDIVNFLLTASIIGMIFKDGSTISAAMGGCQAEIGVSSAMAAAALAEQLGASQHQVLQAAEIAMEHHLGLTCDPIGGLVQIPCIERNTMGAMKAITAAQLSMEGNPEMAKVSLDAVVKTMWETALDMNSKYKETADGGLATNIPISLPEC